MPYGSIELTPGTWSWQAVDLYPSSLHVDWCYNNQPQPDTLIATSAAPCDISSVYKVWFSKPQYQYGEDIVIHWNVSSPWHSSSDVVVMYKESTNWAYNYVIVNTQAQSGFVTFSGTTHTIRQDKFFARIFSPWPGRAPGWPQAASAVNASVINIARLCAQEVVSLGQQRIVQWNTSYWHVNGEFIAMHLVRDCVQYPCVCQRTCPNQRMGTVQTPTLQRTGGTVTFPALSSDPGEFFYVYWSFTNEPLAWTPYLRVGTPNNVTVCSDSQSACSTGSASGSSAGQQSSTGLSAAMRSASAVLVPVAILIGAASLLF
jgi:hypothetical protein